MMHSYYTGQRVLIDISMSIHYSLIWKVVA